MYIYTVIESSNALVCSTISCRQLEVVKKSKSDVVISRVTEADNQHEVVDNWKSLKNPSPMLLS